MSAPVASVPHQLASESTWADLPIVPGQRADGSLGEEIAVLGGDLVRLEVDHALQLGERVRSADGLAEVWSEQVPDHGALLVRSSPNTVALLLPPHAVSRAHLGRGSDPGYFWFDLQKRVLSWANGPFDAPFPTIAARERLDLEGLSALDRALAASVARAGQEHVASVAAHAIRSVVGLRVTRSLQPPSGFPYFLDEKPKLIGSAPEPVGPTHDAYRVASAGWLEISVTGPRLLHVWSKGVRDRVDTTLRIRVYEGTRLRAMGGGTVLRQNAVTPDPVAPDEQPGDVLLRRAVVHVPPGQHRYHIELNGGTAYLRLLLAEPVVHLEDAATGAKDETTQLDLALKTCARDRLLPDLCTLTLALLGRDDPNAAPVAGLVSFSEALDRAPPAVRAIARNLAEGGPRDPTIAWEFAGSDGDATALAQLQAATNSGVDDVVRAAWLRAFTRGTRWSLVPDAQPSESWMSLSFEDDTRPECARMAAAPWLEVKTEDTVLKTDGWYGASAVDLVAVGSCTGGPIALNVDGEALSAAPSSAVVNWHILVKGETARVRRNAGAGHVFAVQPESVACGVHWDPIWAPKLASDKPTLSFAAGTEAAGVDVWLRDGTPHAELDVESLQGAHTARISVAAQAGVSALDARGARWTRVVRVPLPPWAKGGVRIHGPETTAVRAIARLAKQAAPERALAAESAATRNRPVPFDDGALIALSKKILTTVPRARGSLYLERALLLARAGADRAALEDGRAAKALGALGANEQDALLATRDALHQEPLQAALPTGVAAYGVESDFDPHARRCTPSNGPRGALGKAIERLNADAVKAAAAAIAGKPAPSARWDRDFANSAFSAAMADPTDPRDSSVVDRVFRNSWWHALNVTGPHVDREVPPRPESPIDGTGELRPRVVTGEPFEEGHYVTISDRHEVRAILIGAPPAKARLDIVCAPLVASRALGERCPIMVGYANAPPVALFTETDGRLSYEVPPPARNMAVAPLLIGVPKAQARWSAVARIVLDREAPGAVHVDGVGWVVGPSVAHPRVLLEAGRALSLPVESGIYRVDAISEQGTSPRLTLNVEGKEIPVPNDGSPVLFFVRHGARAELSVAQGAASISLAQRVGADTPQANVGDSALVLDEGGINVAPNAASAGETNSSDDAWLGVAEGSSPPLSKFVALQGTVVATALGYYSSLRDADRGDRGVDAYGSLSVGYRRRIAPLDLWTGFDALARLRTTGGDTVGGGAFFYEDENDLHLRLTGGVDYVHQFVPGRPLSTLAPHGFLEYSGRVAPTFFILPRLGYDGFYSSRTTRPRSVDYVDSDAYSRFRTARPSFLFGQALFWWVPYFNDIYYLRARVTDDVVHQHISHWEARPGVFLAFGDLDLSVFGDAIHYVQMPNVQATPSTDYLIGLTATFNRWISAASIDIQPQLGGRCEMGGGGCQIFGGISILASHERGLLDYSSLELDFPEQLGSGVPWRVTNTEAR